MNSGISPHNREKHGAPCKIQKEETAVKARVNENCIGCGLCVSTCPQVFEMTDEGVAKAMEGTLPADVAGAALDAQSGCPVGAIEIE